MNEEETKFLKGVIAFLVEEGRFTDANKMESLLDEPEKRDSTVIALSRAQIVEAAKRYKGTNIPSEVSIRGYTADGRPVELQRMEIVWKSRKQAQGLDEGVSL